MSDRLRQALEDRQREGYFVPGSETESSVLAAARRFLALTETGQEKQAVHLHREQSYVVSVDGPGLYLVIPADYLTEEE